MEAGGADSADQQADSTRASGVTSETGTIAESSKKDIQDCVREIWRVFKSIVQGPAQNDDQGDSDEDEKVSQANAFNPLNLLFFKYRSSSRE